MSESTLHQRDESFDAKDEQTSGVAKVDRDRMVRDFTCLMIQGDAEWPQSIPSLDALRAYYDAGPQTWHGVRGQRWFQAQRDAATVVWKHRAMGYRIILPEAP